MKRSVWLLVVLVLLAGWVSFNWSSEKPAPAPGQAMFFSKQDDGQVWCRLCPRKCMIPDGKRGFCGSRENRGGTLYPLTYGKPCSLGLEPIEKAPFYHFIPGHARFVIAAAGCNLRCKFCQNWSISQASFEDVRSYSLSPQEVVAMALEQKARSICFTFTEPVSFYEYMYDTAKLAREKGLKTSVVTSGFINPEPLKKLLTVMDAVKIDLKAFNEKFYEEMCAAELAPVMKSLKAVKDSGTWLEIVNLVIPTLNDDPADLKRMCEWIKKDLGPDVPVHFTRFHPAYKLTSVPPTPISTLEKAYSIAKEAGLNYVYVGNVPGHEHNSTFCPGCKKMLIQRVQFEILENNIREGKCRFCGRKVSGKWD